MVVMVEICLDFPQMYRLHHNQQIEFCFICSAVGGAVEEATKGEGDL